MSATDAADGMHASRLTLHDAAVTAEHQVPP
jgi:hypothetical protein